MDGISLDVLDGVGVVGVVTLIGILMLRALITGQLCTGRELTEKNKRIETLEVALATRDEQISAALAVLPEVAEYLRSTQHQEGTV